MKIPYIIWREEHLWIVNVLQRIYFSDLVLHIRIGADMFNFILI
jgi:hypothetical protein